MTSPIFKTFSSKTHLTQLATDIIATRLSEDINQADAASFMVSGGSTPGPIYAQLSRIDLPWHKVKIGLVDERWVDETDAGSNAALIRKTLLQNFAQAGTFLPMKTPDSVPINGQHKVERLYHNIPRPYSAVVLGMGRDGHTASWFPKSSGLERALTSNNSVEAITAKPSDVTGHYLDRMTLTRSAVGKCKLALLLIAGAEKRRVFESAFAPHSPLPIRAAIDALGDRLIVLWAP